MERLLPPAPLQTKYMGVARIFQRGGHTLSNRGYSRFRNLNIVGCLSKKRLTKGGSRAPQDPPPGYALEIHPGMSLVQRAYSNSAVRRIHKGRTMKGQIE